jgi:hypothetical protein
MSTITYYCKYCGKNFSVSKFESIRRKKKSLNQLNYCSHSCFCKHKTERGITNINCRNCNKEVKKYISEIKKSKSNNHFCSKSCSVTYNNKNKKYGTQISKLEKLIQVKLLELYPHIVFFFNGKEKINSELDIYIPSLDLGFELNGIFHYEPIFGQNKLNQIQNNDKHKFQSCLEHGIELCVIDVSKTKYIKKNSVVKYLNIITTIIDNKIKEREKNPKN